MEYRCKDKADKIRVDLDKLRADMEAFCSIYEEDVACWQGEAAKEEACYVTSDINEFRMQADAVEQKLNAMEAGK